MAEIYVIATGTMPSLHRWEEDMLSTFWPVWKDGKQTGAGRRLIVAPVQLYKIATNKENIPAVMNIIGTGTNYIPERYKFLGTMIKGIKKLLKLKPVPKPTQPNPLFQPNQVDKAVAIIPIGIKDDAYNTNGEEMI